MPRSPQLGIWVESNNFFRVFFFFCLCFCLCVCLCCCCCCFVLHVCVCVLGEGCECHSVRDQRSEDSSQASSICFPVGSRELRLSVFAESTFTTESPCQPQQVFLRHLDHTSKSMVVGSWESEGEEGK